MMIRKMLNFTLNPQRLIFKIWKRLPLGSFRIRLDYDVLPRPNYAFCVYNAARLAHQLGHARISIAEFGIAGGTGLLELERLAEAVEKEFPVAIDIYGFDTGEGLPEPVDYRDLPYFWKKGFFKMDHDALRAKLSRTTLVLGDVKDTVPGFFDVYNAAPIGAAFFDLDFWSSTCDALKIFETPSGNKLPRVFCYFDDVGSPEDGALMNDYVGQLASICDHNRAYDMMKLTRIAGLHHTRRIPAAWNDKIYLHHTFDHPDYNTYIYGDADLQLPL